MLGSEVKSLAANLCSKAMHPAIYSQVHAHQGPTIPPSLMPICLPPLCRDITAGIKALAFVLQVFVLHEASVPISLGLSKLALSCSRMSACAFCQRVLRLAVLMSYGLVDGVEELVEYVNSWLAEHDIARCIVLQPRRPITRWEMPAVRQGNV